MLVELAVRVVAHLEKGRVKEAFTGSVAQYSDRLELYSSIHNKRCVRHGKEVA